MAPIPGTILARLRAAGLLVTDPYPADHTAYPDGVTIAKPTATPGHHLPNYRTTFGSQDIELDAPTLTLHHDTHWVVSSQDYIPGPGPGDFVDRWPTGERALADILDFYFGDPARMQRKRRR